MAEEIKKYRISKYKDGRIALVIEDKDRGECSIVLSKSEIKTLIIDLLNCLKHGTTLSGAASKL